MFSEGERSGLRHQLVAAARLDEQIEAAAVVGSGARDREDEWSDIDLALRLAADLSPEDVVGKWTVRMYEAHAAVAHLDIWSGPTLFRVFLLASSLQVDLSFWPSDVFAASGGSFRLLFGHANEPAPPPVRVPDTLIGMGWLYALHARSSIARGRVLQAMYMINGIRDQVVALACLRHSLPPDQGRGVDDLPDDVKRMIADTVARGLGQLELNRSFAVVTRALLIEANHIDPLQSLRLEAPVRELVRTAADVPPKPATDPESEFELARYYLTDQLDDLAGGGTAATIDATVIEVWRGTADLLLAAAGRWSGTGKWLIREVEALDEAMGTVFAARLHDALHVALAGNPIPLVDIADEVLNQVGGRVWAGFRVGASIPNPD